MDRSGWGEMSCQSAPRASKHKPGRGHGDILKHRVTSRGRPERHQTHIKRFWVGYVSWERRMACPCLELGSLGWPNFEGVWTGCVWGSSGGNLV